jgi:L-rhamnose isomerase
MIRKRLNSISIPIETQKALNQLKDQRKRKVSLVRFHHEINQDSNNSSLGNIQAHFNGFGGTIAIGTTAAVRIAYDCVIKTIECISVGTALGSVVVNVFKDNYNNLPPSEKVFTDSSRPSINSDVKSFNSDPQFETNGELFEGEWLYFSIASISNITQLSISIQVQS